MYKLRTKDQAEETLAVIHRKPEKLSPERDPDPWPLR